MSRNLRRLAGVVRLGLARFTGRLFGGDSRQLWSSIAGVAFAVMLMTTVGGISLGLASQSAIESEDVDYWVVPDAASASAIAVSVDAPRLGGVHSVTDRLAEDDRVDYATPVLIRVLELSNPQTGHSEYVLVAGVIPDSTSRSIIGLPTAPLEPGDPHYADGNYDGRWTGQAVLSSGAATLLDAEQGTTLSPKTGSATNRSLTVSGVAESEYTTGVGEVPVALVHLSEAQTLSGATSGDQADQILVSTDDAAVAGDIEQLYPQTNVVKRTGFAQQQLSSSSLPLAIAVGAVLTAFVVGTLFVATMMGLEVLSERASLATLAAIGYSSSSRSLLLVVETLGVTLSGAVVGLGLGIGGIELTNVLTERYLGITSVARFDPLLVAAAFVVSVLIGLFASVYPVWLSHRANPVEVLQ
ncbi:ABC transporter permease [Haloferax larsenii]|uniref:Putative ABC transport system permease protein n=1 Tax=Haloferax larsenii TaxID=302484 RepID=A0A1H7TED0_HALLR|nr:FtsX-like permease family protein [Haloferax larsenii]SEL82895.1 putative ABC transport system permease protein [Haloferax larsenii]